ncbi:MAG: hypothetical protein V3W20_03785 [Candidatus Neomarinimicrobiota bacterium]
MAITVEIWNTSTNSFNDITEYFSALELDVEVEIEEGHLIKYKSQSFEIPAAAVTIANDDYIRFYDDVITDYVYSGFVENVQYQHKADRWIFDIMTEIDKLKSFLITRTLTGSDIEARLEDALTNPQNYLRYDICDYPFLDYEPVVDGWTSPDYPGFLTKTTYASTGTQSLFTNTPATISNMVNTFTEKTEGKLTVEHKFYITAGGDASSWLIEVYQTGFIAASYTVDNADILQHETGSGMAACSGNPTINRGSWNTLKIECDIDEQEVNTWLNDVQVDTAFGFAFDADGIDKVRFVCDLVTGDKDFYIDDVEIYHQGILDTWTVSGEDAISLVKLALDNSDYVGMTSIVYPGDIVIGTDTNDYNCLHPNDSDNYKQPITGARYDYYFELVASGGSAWASDKFYNQATFNDLLHDSLLMMNGETINHFVFCSVINHEIRFYSWTEAGSPGALTESLIVEFIEADEVTTFVKHCGANCSDYLRGDGTVTHPAGVNYDYEYYKHEHKVKYAGVLKLLLEKIYSGAFGIVTSQSLRKSIHEYTLTGIELKGVI